MTSTLSPRREGKKTSLRSTPPFTLTPAKTTKTKHSLSPFCVLRNPESKRLAGQQPPAPELHRRRGRRVVRLAQHPRRRRPPGRRGADERRFSCSRFSRRRCCRCLGGAVDAGEGHELPPGREQGPQRRAQRRGDGARVVRRGGGSVREGAASSPAVVFVFRASLCFCSFFSAFFAAAFRREGRRCSSRRRCCCRFFCGQGERLLEAGLVEASGRREGRKRSGGGEGRCRRSRGGRRRRGRRLLLLLLSLLLRVSHGGSGILLDGGGGDGRSRALEKRSRRRRRRRRSDDSPRQRQSSSSSSSSGNSSSSGSSGNGSGRRSQGPLLPREQDLGEQGEGHGVFVCEVEVASRERRFLREEDEEEKKEGEEFFFFLLEKNGSVFSSIFSPSLTRRTRN